MITNYYNTFQARMTADGFNYKEQIEKLSRKNFDNYLEETPTSVKIKYNNKNYKVAIVENKQDEFRLSKQMLSSINNYIPIGALIYWEYYNPKDSPENYWIVWKQQQNSIQDYNVSYISRCNHKLKWIDSQGVRHEQYVYEFSSKENMIRATFKSRVQEIIASEPNKFMEIIMPFTEDIKREQRFIVDGEAWYVIEFDSSSVDGITYITLGEDKKDLQNDLLIAQKNNEDLADYKNENKYYISVINTNPIVEYGTSYIIKPYYYKDGIFIENNEFNYYINGELVGSGVQYEQEYYFNTEVVIELKDNKEINLIINILISEDTIETIDYKILGDNSIKWGKTAIYSVVYEQYGIIYNKQEVTYNISNEELASLEQEEGIAYITGNNKRKSGEIILTAIGDNFSIKKAIKITSLW